jgi:hypothetical protein
MARTASELVNTYYDGWRKGDWKKGKVDLDLFHPSRFRLCGAIDQFEKREDFGEALVEKVGKHLDFGTILHQFRDGNDICTIYDFKANNILVPTSEWIHAEDGFITKIVLIFDPTKLAKGLM